jgi:adenylosuccinate lyase
VAGFAASVSKFAFDLRVLASSPFGELGEPFGRKQVGSSAMPFKRNPMLCERMNSLARIPAANAQIAWQNAADNLLERTLDDSANRRSIIPESFLAADELASLGYRVISGLRVERRAIARNLAKFGPFAATEAVLMAAVRGGADRQAMHERLRELSMQAWSAVEQDEGNPLADILKNDPDITRYVRPADLDRLMHVEGHTGLAAERARAFAKRLQALGGTVSAASVLDIKLT